MKIRLLNLNIEKGRFLKRIIEFLNKEQFDVVHLQEVSGGFFHSLGKDSFMEIIQSTRYNGEIAKYICIKNRPETYVGNAIFYNKNLTILDKKIVFFKKFKEFNDINAIDWRTCPRNLLSTKLRIINQKIIFINTHLPWDPSPLDTDLKILQSKKLVSYMKNVISPFVLTGDFNVDSRSQITKSLNQLARNLTIEAGVTNTLDPELHKVKKLFPEGLAVDFAFVSHELKHASVFVLKNEQLSDHLGQIVEFEF